MSTDSKASKNLHPFFVEEVLMKRGPEWKVPSLQDLLASSEVPSGAAPENSAKRPSGLFSALVQDPRILYEDLLREPSKYNQELLPLLTKLLSGSADVNSVSAAEKRLLDEAVHDLVKKPSSNVLPAQSKSSTQSRQKKPEQKTEEPEEQLHEEPVDANGLRPYWWL